MAIQHLGWNQPSGIEQWENPVDPSIKELMDYSNTRGLLWDSRTLNEVQRLLRAVVAHANQDRRRKQHRSVKTPKTKLLKEA